MKKKLAFNEFVSKSNIIHGTKYVYHEDTFNGSHQKTLITCPIHGDFLQTAKRHMEGQGCPGCGKETAKLYHKHNYTLFLKNAYEKFGNKFSFPNIEKLYVNGKTPITIKCNECNREFSKRPNDFLSNNFKGCKHCKKLEAAKHKAAFNDMHKTNKWSFLKCFKNKFGDTVTPYIDEYKSVKKEIHFKCNICGSVFKKKPSNCLNSAICCPKCKDASRKKQSAEKFFEKAKDIYGDKYDYSKTEYKGTDILIDVICHAKDKFANEHGVFKVTPHAHIGTMRSGCPKCSGKFRKDTDYFVQEAKIIHGDKYDYSKVNYEKALKKVEIICPIHGSFFIKPNDHLCGEGCKKCGHESSKEKLSMTTDEFIAKAKSIHNGLYDYSKTDLKHRDENGKVLITCPKHGEFWQTPQSHLRGKGCPKCKQSHLENEVMVFLENNHIDYIPQKKFSWLGKKSLDFYLPKYNTAIECQGKQHFADTLFGNFQSIFENDKKKKELCDKNGVKLLYYSNLNIEYPYQVYEDKEALLKEIIK